MISVGVIGYGYWGPNLVRNFAELPDARVAWVTDLRQDRFLAVTARYPTTKLSANHNDIICDSSVDAVVIATPVHTHFDLGLAALKAGKHVLMEKPLASTSDHAARLIDEAERRGLALMVDHTFVFTPAVQKIRELTQGGELGDIHYYDSVRINLGLFQHDVNVLWDLAVHDLSVSNSLSSRHWELDQVPAVGDPTDIVQFGTGHRVAAGEGQRRVALQRRVAAHLVVGGLEVGKCPFKITGIPEQHMVETFSPRRADQALHEWV